jgi:hypothetical protein
LRKKAGGSAQPNKDQASLHQLTSIEVLAVEYTAYSGLRRGGKKFHGEGDFF